MADEKKLDRANKKGSNIRAALVTTTEKGVVVDKNGAMTRTPNELGKERDMEQ